MTNIYSDVNIFWFRRDLRLEDNIGLYHALQSGKQVYPLFIYDTDILSQLEDRYDKRLDFIQQTLLGLQKQLENFGSSLFVKVGRPIDVFNTLITERQIKSVFCNRDYEPYALERDNTIKLLLEQKNIEFLTFKDQVIFEGEEIMKGNGEPYTVFTPYSKQWKLKLTGESYFSCLSENLLERFVKIEKNNLPELEDIGFHKTNLVLTYPLVDENVIRTYDETRNYPAIKGSTELSVHLRFGTISIRKLVSLAVKLNDTWLNELIWREFFMSILFHFPHVEKGPFKKKYESISWRNNGKDFNCWCEGKTGYPIVDAGMRQLNETGWMHNRVRMIVASFLTKHLLIDWRWGEAYFAIKLLDYDLSANNGNWQWVAGCGCDAAPYFRIFNPWEQTKRYDPDLKYVHKWVKELDSMEYPQPIVEHSFARNRALEAYKKGINNNESNDYN